MHNDHLLTIHDCFNDLQRQMRDEARSVDMDNVSGYSTDQDAKNREKVSYFEFYSYIPVGDLGIILKVGHWTFSSQLVVKVISASKAAFTTS